MKGKLKPCPFCGEIPNIMKARSLDNISTFYIVHCVNDVCSIVPMTSPYYNEQSAIDAWNTRHNGGGNNEQKS